MTPSKWTTIAWDKNGKLCEGKIEAEGTIFEIYENWLYVQDEKAWRENSGFGRHTIMEISEGQLRYNRFKIIVGRGDNDELFFVIEYNDSIHKEKGKEDDNRQMIGFSYCVSNDADDIKLAEEVKEEFFYWLEYTKEDWWYNISLDLEKIKDFDKLNQGSVLIAEGMGIGTDKESKRIKDEYPDGRCPDCNKPIADDVVKGGECPNCGHVFRSNVDEKIMERRKEMLDEGYMQRQQGWKKGMGL